MGERKRKKSNQDQTEKITSVAMIGFPPGPSNGSAGSFGFGSCITWSTSLGNSFGKEKLSGIWSDLDGLSSNFLDLFSKAIPSSSSSSSTGLGGSLSGDGGILIQTRDVIRERSKIWGEWEKIKKVARKEILDTLSTLLAGLRIPRVWLPVGWVVTGGSTLFVSGMDVSSSWSSLPIKMKEGFLRQKAGWQKRVLDRNPYLKTCRASFWPELISFWSFSLVESGWQ